MTEVDEPEPTRKRGTKLSRNEGRKLMATACNNAGLAFLLASVLQPIVSSAQVASLPEWRTLLVSAILILASGALFAAAQSVIHRMEE